MKTLIRTSLVAVAALTLTAFSNVATAAATPGFVAAQYQVTVQGLPSWTSGVVEHNLDAFGEHYWCDETPPFEGLELLKGPSPTISMFVTETGKCSSVGVGNKYTINWHHCGLRFEPGSDPEKHYEGTVSRSGLKDCSLITIEDQAIFNSCTISIELRPTGTSGTVWFENTKGGVVVAHTTLYQLPATRSGSGCATEIGTATYTPSWGISGLDFSSPRKQVAMEVVSKLP